MISEMPTDGQRQSHALVEKETCTLTSTPVLRPMVYMQDFNGLSFH
jgi:hypothetical protein